MTMPSKLVKTVAISAIALVLVLLGLVFVLLRSNRVDGEIIMATGNATYHDLAATYRADLETNGVTLELRDTTEGFATLQALVDDKSGVNTGFVKGGLVGSLQGRLASEKAKDWRQHQLGKWLSIGRVLFEPIWVFTRGDLPIQSLRDLKHRRILVGLRDGGTRRIATQLLNANGINSSNATLIEEILAPDAAQIHGGNADAAILITAPDTDRIQQLLRVPDIRLMNFAPEAEAYTNRFPALTKLVLREGAVEFDPLLPSADITLLATSAALVVRSDLHPALISLLTHAMLHNPKSGFDKSGDPVLFYKAGEFPSSHDPEFRFSSDALAVHKSGELPTLLRVIAPLNKRMGLPFSLSAFANAHGAQTILLLIPLLAIALPLMKAIPALYVWSIRRRLLYWYRQLTALERTLERPDADAHVRVRRADLERIDAGVRRIRIPIYFADQVYDLRGHIDLVRQRLAVMPEGAPVIEAH
jgi:TRAP-type uncharacterized transport system substrate-binding protein